MTEPKKLWGGRFRQQLDPMFAAFQESLSDDHVLAFADLETNLAWSEVLTEAGVLSEDEGLQVRAAIEALAMKWADEGVPLEVPDEDIHSLVERELVERCGDLGKRIHTGKSRNDQVATDLRLFLRERAFAVVASVDVLCAALVEKADRHGDAPMPGYTHLQRGQPITIGHHALAHAEALGRDRERLIDAIARLDRCPLGAAALAGTTIPVDREALAERLDFSGGALRNSLDATASRDHLCELLFACAMAMTNLSRLAEDYVFFATHEARFLRFGDAVSTGSSLMPQKRNPDAFELVRGKAAKVQGALMTMLTTLKGLPLAYNRDLQADKETLLPALDETEACLEVAALAVEHAEFDVERCRQEAGRGYLNATDLADLLVAAGVPFRDAHELVGRAVDRAVELGVELDALPDDDQRALLPQLGTGWREALSVDAVLARRAALGGTAPACVAQQVTEWRQRLVEWQEDLVETIGDPHADHDGEDCDCEDER